MRLGKLPSHNLTLISIVVPRGTIDIQSINYFLWFGFEFTIGMYQGNFETRS